MAVDFAAEAGLLAAVLAEEAVLLPADLAARADFTAGILAEEAVLVVAFAAEAVLAAVLATQACFFAADLAVEAALPAPDFSAEADLAAEDLAAEAALVAAAFAEEAILVTLDFAVDAALVTIDLAAVVFFFVDGAADRLEAWSAAMQVTVNNTTRLAPRIRNMAGPPLAEAGRAGRLQSHLQYTNRGGCVKMKPQPFRVQGFARPNRVGIALGLWDGDR